MRDPAPPAALLSLARIARRLGVTQRWLCDEADAGRVPCLRADKRYLFAPTAVERMIAERAAATPKQTAGEGRRPPSSTHRSRKDGDAGPI